jgi:hypothetical protein
MIRYIFPLLGALELAPFSIYREIMPDVRARSTNRENSAHLVNSGPQLGRRRLVLRATLTLFAYLSNEYRGGGYKE